MGLHVKKRNQTAGQIGQRAPKGTSTAEGSAQKRPRGAKTSGSFEAEATARRRTIEKRVDSQENEN